jgi:hypothetical protein
LCEPDARSQSLAQTKGHIFSLVFGYLSLTCLGFGGLSFCGVLRYSVSSPVINIGMHEGVNSHCYQYYDYLPINSF